MAEYSIFQILEQRGERGFFPLNENHWSNMLAWLLDPRSENAIGRHLLEWLSQGWNFSTWKVGREIDVVVGCRRRKIDIHIESDRGHRQFIEVKIDPAYVDRDQLIDQLSILGANEQLVVISPLDLSSLLAEAISETKTSAKAFSVTWHSVAKWCSEQRRKTQNAEPLTAVIMEGVDGYWSNFVTTPFEQMVQTIINEQGWTSFFPDDFKEVFLQRFPEVWTTWLAERPKTGNGNPHQYLMTCLSMLANRRNGFRLIKTGISRKPNQPNWGFALVHELGLVTCENQPEE